MASLASSAVTVLREWVEPSIGNHVGRTCRLLNVVVATMGTVANPLLVSAMGFAKAEEVSGGINSASDKMYTVDLNYDGTIVLLKASATFVPADFSEATGIRILVKGWVNTADVI